MAEPVREQSFVRKGTPNRAERGKPSRSNLRRVLNVGCTTKRQNGSQGENFFGKEKRKFSDGAEGTHGEAKRRGIFSAEAETSCNAEAKKGIKAEPRAVGSSRMMVFTHKLRKRESALGRIGAYFAQSF